MENRQPSQIGRGTPPIFQGRFLMVMLDENNNLCYTTIKEKFEQIKKLGNPATECRSS